jgi:hypothetical protein
MLDRQFSLPERKGSQKPGSSCEVPEIYSEGSRSLPFTTLADLSFSLFSLLFPNELRIATLQTPKDFSNTT